MKKFYSYFMALALVFAGVACIPIGGDTGIAKVTFEECEVLPAEGGAHTLTYAITNPISGAELILGEPSAEWLHDLVVVDASTVSFVVDANEAAPGTEPREATFTATYATLEALTVTVKQSATEASFSIEFSNCTTTSALATITPAEGVGTYYWKKASESDLVGYESNAAWLKSKIDTSWFVTLNEGVLENQSISEYYGAAYIIIAGAVETENGYEFTTPVHTFQVPLVPKPVLTITPLENSVSHEAGVITLNYSVEHAVEGSNVTLSKDAAWTTTTIEEGIITIAYSANEYAKTRTASLSFSYPNVDAATVVTLTQEANPTAEVVTFSLEVTETHFDHVIVNVTPSSATTKFALGGVSKYDFDGYAYSGSDSNLQADLTSSYKKPAILTGAQTGYKLKVSPSDYYGWDYYIYAYAVSEDEAVATSDVHKVLVTVKNDKPAITFETSPFEVSAEGGTYTIKYTISNPVNGGVVKFNGSQSNYYGVLVNDSWSINNEKCEITIQVNPYDTSQYSHYATIYIAYYADETSTTSLATASLKINQLAPAN